MPSMDLILRPVRLALSTSARKAYLNTALFLATSVSLFGLAIVAYVLFYLNYIPKIGIERIVHLQYGIDGSSPYGLVSLDNSVIPQQAYDVVVEIDLPTSPANTDLGNFMVNMAILSSAYKDAGRPPTTKGQSSDPHSWIPAASILLSSRRPAILTFQSNIVSLSKQVTGLPWYVLGWRRESERLRIPMAEGILFEKGHKNTPAKVYLDIQCRNQQALQVYNMSLLLRAQFSGLRWLMYNHRIVSFVMFTTAFWFAEVFFALVAWVLLESRLNAAVDQTSVVKQEGQSGNVKVKTETFEDDSPDIDDSDLSDAPPSFSTYDKRIPVRHEPKVKKEDDEGELISNEIRTHPRTAEANVGSEGLIYTSDVFRGEKSHSGVGASFSEGGDGLESTAQRRRARTGKGLSLEV